MKKPEIHVIYCKRCQEPWLVVKGSAPDEERLCNLCIYEEIGDDSGYAGPRSRR